MIITIRENATTSSLLSRDATARIGASGRQGEVGNYFMLGPHNSLD